MEAREIREAARATADRRPGVRRDREQGDRERPLDRSGPEDRRGKGDRAPVAQPVQAPGAKRGAVDPVVPRGPERAAARAPQPVEPPELAARKTRAHPTARAVAPRGAAGALAKVEPQAPTEAQDRGAGRRTCASIHRG